MKRLIISLLVLLFLNAYAMAQKKWEIKAGINYSTIQGENTTLKSGFSLGIARNWYISKNTAITAEILYCHKRGTVDNKIIAAVGTMDRRISHADIYYSFGSLEIPLFLRAYLPIELIKPSVYIGPSISFGINDRSSKKNVKKELVSGEEEARKRVNYYVNEDPGPLYELDSTGFGLNIGMEIKWPHLSFELRYFMTFFDLEVISALNFHEKADSYQCIIGIPF
jgi:hypothetical protein